MVHIIKIFIFQMILVFSSLAFAGSLSGVWKGKEYNIDLSNTFNDIEGHWGEVVFDLNVSETFQDIDGTIDNNLVDLSISSTFTSVDGKLPCGDVDYDYSITFKEVEGIICGQKFEIDLDFKEDVIPTAQNIILDEILSSFPQPARGSIRRFILSRIQF